MMHALGLQVVICEGLNASRILPRSADDGREAEIPETQWIAFLVGGNGRRLRYDPVVVLVGELWLKRMMSDVERDDF
jgi:hypothetical protein